MKLSQIYISGDVIIYIDWKTPKINPTYLLLIVSFWRVWVNFLVCSDIKGDLLTGIFVWYCTTYRYDSNVHCPEMTWVRSSILHVVWNLMKYVFKPKVIIHVFGMKSFCFREGGNIGHCLHWPHFLWGWGGSILIMSFEHNYYFVNCIPINASCRLKEKENGGFFFG